MTQESRCNVMTKAIQTKSLFGETSREYSLLLRMTTCSSPSKLTVTYHKFIHYLE